MYLCYEIFLRKLIKTLQNVNIVLEKLNFIRKYKINENSCEYCKVGTVSSASGNTVTSKRTLLDPDHVEDLVTIYCNLEQLQEFENNNKVWYIPNEITIFTKFHISFSLKYKFYKYTLKFNFFVKRTF